jgi:protein-histidine pros-kinase
MLAERKRRVRLGIRTKFNLTLLAAFLVGLALAGVIARQILRDNAAEEVRQQASLMIAEATAVRDYTANEVGPLLAEQTRQRFLPQTIPFWAAQTSFRSVHKQFPEYAYKEAALNPTNPADRATDWQADIIDAFKQNADLHELASVRRTPQGTMLNLSRPVRVDDAGCLPCHSVPSAAPPSMIDLYGSANGFGWKMGDVVGAQIVSVPMQLALDRADRTLVTFMASLAGVFALMLVMMNLLLHYSVLRPLKRIATVADDISLGNMDAPELVPNGRDEVALLMEAFNRMRRSLANAMRMLTD